MNIDKKTILIRDLIKSYSDDPETGRVSGYDGKLDIRPAYQREFVYKEKQRNKVIDSVVKGRPLNIMYWAKTPTGFEVLDGQQRTISICQYCNDEFSIDYRYFHNLTQDEKDAILNYELDVYQCDGTDKEKLDWFGVVNIAGEKLTEQEVRNAVYAGTWLGDAKKKFSFKNCVAYHLAKDYMSGSPIRQDYLETALKWISRKEGIALEDYMAKHQSDPNANALWTYFSAVIEWVKSTFPTVRKQMKTVDWGALYDAHKDEILDTDKLEKRIQELLIDDDVTKKAGVYEYVLNGNEKALSIRAFSDAQKTEAYEKQKGICPVCGKHFEYGEMHGDHITPWSKGGKTIAGNCQMLCAECNRKKSAI